MEERGPPDLGREGGAPDPWGGTDSWEGGRGPDSKAVQSWGRWVWTMW